MDVTGHLEAHLPADVAAWLEGRGDDLSQAWRSCTHGHWLIHMAAVARVDRVLLVHAAADVAGAALARRHATDERAARALRTALAWVDGRTRSAAAWACGFAAVEAADAEPDPCVAAALRAAAFVAFACDDDADASFYAHRAYAAKAVEQAALALGSDGPTPAALVRARIPLRAFVSAFEVASRPPPPLPDVDPDAITDSFYA